MYKSTPTSGGLVAFTIDWDAGNREKCQAHGVSVDEIETLFQRRFAVFPALAHSSPEARFKAFGIGDAGRRIFVVFTLRERSGKAVIRPISARYMHKKEVRHYEEEAAYSQTIARSEDG
jgi:uncharacterized protein